MSFVLELDAPAEAMEAAERLERATEAEGYLRVRRRRRWLRPVPPALSLDDTREDIHVLSEHADWSESAFTLDERGRELLARTVLLLADELGPGWALRACWMGDPCEEERMVTPDDLVQLVRTSQLERATRYRVV